MCGINSILHLDKSPVVRESIHYMNDKMIHRGPDDQGIWLTQYVGLGCRRLSIIDTLGARQPITNEDETMCIVCNGEIYNYQTLRNELKAKGHQFRTKGDTETILHLYEEYGTDCLNYLRGMFVSLLFGIVGQKLFLPLVIFLGLNHFIIR